MEFIEQKLSDKEYKQLFIDSFGGYIHHTKHNILLCKEDNNTVAVLNYFIYEPDTLFLHRSWFLPKYSNKIKKIKYWLGLYKYLKDRGIRYIMGVINSENKPALIWALKTGFNITGIRQNQDKTLIIDIIKDLEGGE